MGGTFTSQGFIVRWTKVQTKCFTLPVAGLMTLNKFLNSFEPPLGGFYEDKEITWNY